MDQQLQPMKATEAVMQSMLVAAEFGYRCAEKGMNLEATLDEVRSTFK